MGFEPRSVDHSPTLSFLNYLEHFHLCPFMLPCKASRRKDKGKIMSEMEFLGVVGTVPLLWDVIAFGPQGYSRNTGDYASHFAGKEMEFLEYMGFLSL